MAIDLDPIKQRIKAAPGPLMMDRSGRLYGPNHRSGSIVTREGWGQGVTAAFRDLLMHAPTDIAQLLEEVERLRAALRAYGGHARTCDHEQDTSYPCSCGLVNSPAHQPGQ